MSAVAAVMAGSVFAAGEIEFKLDKASDWKVTSPVKWVGKDKKTMEVAGPTTFLSVKKFDVDVNKYYKLEADIKQISGGPIHSYVGFKLFDKNDKEITAPMVNARPGSETTVVKAVKAGDKVMFVKANAKWTSGIAAVALNAKKDLSDLPNYDLLVPAKITAKGQVIEIQLRQPAPKNIAAGTVVRAQTGGGFMYTGGGKLLKDGQEGEFKGTAKGFNPYFMTSGRWAPGTAKAQIILLVNWKWGLKVKPVAQVKDVELEIK